MKKGIKNKKMTINELAGTVGKLAIITKNGFGKIDKKIDHIENLVDNIENLVDNLAISTKNGFGKIDKKIDQHDKILEVMIKEIKTIHEDNKYFRSNISGLNVNNFSCDKKIENLTVRVEKLENVK